jgi:hypothetical protein
MTGPDRVVVLRHHWPVLTVTWLSTVVLIVAINGWLMADRSTLIDLVIAFTASMLVYPYVRQRTVLTEQGMVIQNLGRTFVPWSHVGRITVRGAWWNGRYIRVFDVVANRTRRLTAPAGAFGVGNRDVDRAQQLIEQWWVHYRGAQPATRTAPARHPGLPDDPYAPPANQ